MFVLGFRWDPMPMAFKQLLFEEIINICSYKLDEHLPTFEYLLNSKVVSEYGYIQYYNTDDV